MIFEFLIPRRPVSLQTRKKRNLQAWKTYVNSEASKIWNGTLITSGDLQLSLVYLSDAAPVDIDNIIKPIQDALVGLVYEDDILVTDVESHRRSIHGAFDVNRCPALILQGASLGDECVYVRVSAPKALEDYL